MAVDCPDAAGRYDHLYIDSDLDGSLADEKPIKANWVQDTGRRKRHGFKLVKVVLPGVDGPLVRWTRHRGRQEALVYADRL